MFLLGYNFGEDFFFDWGWPQLDSIKNRRVQQVNSSIDLLPTNIFGFSTNFSTFPVASSITTTPYLDGSRTKGFIRIDLLPTNRVFLEFFHEIHHYLKKRRREKNAIGVILNFPARSWIFRRIRHWRAPLTSTSTRIRRRKYPGSWKIQDYSKISPENSPEISPEEKRKKMNWVGSHVVTIMPRQQVR